MEFEKKAPDWSAEGIEPPVSLKESGFQAGYKPPAAYFNWFWNRVSACLTELQAKLGFVQKNAALPIVEAISADGIAYTATVEGVTELYNGLTITVIPNMNSASKTITLDVNGLGAKMVRVPLSFNNAAMTTPRLDNYYSEGRPLTLQYDGGYLNGDGIWKTMGKQRTSAQDLYGTVPIESGGTDADNAADARKNLDVLASGEVPQVFTQVAALPVSGWVQSGELLEQTAAVTGVTVDQNKTSVIVSPPANREMEEAYLGAEVRASGQADGTVTFTCTDLPEIDLEANVMVIVLGVRES